MKKYIVPLIGFAIFAGVSIWLVVKMPQLITYGFVLCAGAVGFFVFKNNFAGAKKKVTE